MVRVIGPPGIGKSRIAREVASMASAQGIGVFSAYCQSHTAEIPFGVATALLRSVFGILGRSPEVARTITRSTLPNADAEDLLLLDDMLGIIDMRNAGR